MGRDSNSRDTFMPTRFPGVRLQPLGHPSGKHVTRSCVSQHELHSGQGEIRTHDTVAGMPVFETGAFNHSATCPTNCQQTANGAGLTNRLRRSLGK